MFECSLQSWSTLALTERAGFISILKKGTKICSDCINSFYLYSLIFLRFGIAVFFLHIHSDLN